MIFAAVFLVRRRGLLSGRPAPRNRRRAACRPCRATPRRAASCPMTCHLSPPGQAMPRHAMPCHSMPLHAVPFMPFHAIPCHAMPCHAIPCHTMPYHAIPCHSMPYHAIPCHTIPPHAMPACHAMPCHDGSHAITCSAMPHPTPSHPTTSRPGPSRPIPSHPIPSHPGPSQPGGGAYAPHARRATRASRTRTHMRARVPPPILLPLLLLHFPELCSDVIVELAECHVA